MTRRPSKPAQKAATRKDNPDSALQRADPISKADAAHWEAVVEALKTKTMAPRRPRGE